MPFVHCCPAPYRRASYRLVVCACAEFSDASKRVSWSHLTDTGTGRPARQRKGEHDDRRPHRGRARRRRTRQGQIRGHSRGEDFGSRARRRRARERRCGTIPSRREGDRPAGTPCRIAPQLAVRERAPLGAGTARDFRRRAARRHPTMAVPGIPGIPRSSLAPPALS